MKTKDEHLDLIKVYLINKDILSINHKVITPVTDCILDPTLIEALDEDELGIYNEILSINNYEDLDDYIDTYGELNNERDYKALLELIIKIHTS